MTRFLICSIAVASLLMTGCSDPDAKEASKKEKEELQREKDASPTFMFWCFRKEIQEEQYHVPKLTNEEAARYLQGHLKTIPGLVDIAFNLSEQTVTVKYKTSTVRKMNIEEKIALTGFAVNGRPANPKAKLPEGVN